MKSKLKLDDSCFLGNIEHDFYSDKINPWLMDKLKNGGHGEIIEELTMEFLNNRYCNIKRSNKNESYDFKTSSKCLVDVRRVSPKNTVNLGYTNAKSANIHWRKKSEFLENGGYLIVNISNNSFGLHFLKSKSLLKFEISKLRCLDLYTNYPKINDLSRIFPKLSINN